MVRADWISAAPLLASHWALRGIERSLKGREEGEGEEEVQVGSAFQVFLSARFKPCDLST